MFVGQTIRCKMECYETTQRMGGGNDPVTGEWVQRPLYGAKLQVVCDGSPENKAFFASTPTGRFEVESVNPDFFKPGVTYYVDFTAASA